MSEPIPHKPVRLPGRPRGTAHPKRKAVVPVLQGDDIEYRIRIIREAGRQCVETLRCVAGACEVICRRCEPTPMPEGGDNATA